MAGSTIPALAPEPFSRIWSITWKDAYETHPLGSPHPPSKRNPIEKGVRAAIEEWQSKCYRNWRFQYEIWPATSFEGQCNTSELGFSDTKFFCFLFEHEKHIVPVRYKADEGAINPNGRVEHLALVRVGLHWIPIGQWLSRFVDYSESLGLSWGNLSLYWDFPPSLGKFFPIMKLPGELRNRIWEFAALQQNETQHKMTPYQYRGKKHIGHAANLHNIGLLRVNRAIYREASYALFRISVLQFSEVWQIEKFFRKVHIDSLNAIRTLVLTFQNYSDYLEFFGARINSEVELTASPAATVIRSMGNLREFRIVIDEMRYSKPDCQLWDSSNPCQTIVTDWILEAMFPWTCQVDKIQIKGYIKDSQKSNFRKHRALLKDKNINRSELTRTVLRDAIRGHTLIKLSCWYMADGHITNRNPRVKGRKLSENWKPKCNCPTRCSLGKISFEDDDEQY